MLTDSRVIKQAQILVTSDFEAKPLLLEVYKLLIQKGANEVRFNTGSYEFSEIFFKNASNDQINYFPQIAIDEMKKMDCYIGISSVTNTRGLSQIDAKNMSIRAKVVRPITDYRVEKTRWVITRFPTNAQAQEADMSLSDYSDFVFNAVNRVDWKKKFKEQETLRKLIDATKEVHILGEETDLRLTIAGRKAENCAGEHNMPDGEVFTSVVEDSANGFISYSFPALYMGREYHDIRLEFRNGKVVKATASKG